MGSPKPPGVTDRQWLDFWYIICFDFDRDTDLDSFYKIRDMDREPLFHSGPHHDSVYRLKAASNLLSARLKKEAIKEWEATRGV